MHAFDSPSRASSAGGEQRPQQSSKWLRRRSAARLLSEPRYRIVLATFFATFAAYVERTGFSLAYTALAGALGVDEGTKGVVMSAFYWGYGVSQIPGGWAAQRFGGRHMLAVCFSLWSAASLCTPHGAGSTAHMAAARVLVGVAQGFLIPAVHTVLSQWVPAHERARCVSLATSGMYLGSAAAMWLLPGIAAVLGPASLFKVDALVGGVWLAGWLALGRAAPPASPRIPVTAKEAGHGAHSAARGRGGAPWGAMLRHPAVWAIVVNNFTFHYAVFMIMNWLPTYFASALHADLGSLGAAKMLPYLVLFATSNAGGWAGDWLIISQRATVSVARKAVNSAGFLASCGALMCMAAARDVRSGVAATSLTLGCLGFARGGFSVNHMDIAPKYAGVLMGISNTAGTLSGVIGVAVTGHLLEWYGGSNNPAGWTAAFVAAVANCTVGSVVFALFARGDRLFGA